MNQQQGNTPPPIAPLQCMVCDCYMNNNTAVKTDPQTWINKSARHIGLTEGEEPNPKFQFQFATNVQVCRRCFWRIVQRIADGELTMLLTPQDFK